MIFYILHEELTDSNIGEISEHNRVVYSEENVLNEESLFFSNSKNRIDTCMDNSRPSLALGLESIKQSFLNAKGRGVELRYITEITKQNIPSSTLHKRRLYSPS